MSQIDSVVPQLQAERKQLLDSLTRVDKALKLLRGTDGKPSGRRSLSAAARARIAAAQRARWASGKSKKALAVGARTRPYEGRETRHSCD